MLRAERNYWRFADQVRKPLLVARRESIVAAWNDVVQFVERVAVWHPGFAFLIGVKKVAIAIKSERVRNANAGRDGFELACGSVPLLNRAAFGMNVVERNLVIEITTSIAASFQPGAFLRLQILSLAQAVGVRVIRHDQSEIKVAFVVKRHRSGIHPTGSSIGRRPAAGNDFLRIGFAVAVRVAQQGNFTVRGDVKPVRGPGHSDRHADGWFVPEKLRRVFQAVAIRIAKQPDAAVVTKRGQAPVGGEAKVVGVWKIYRQFAHGKPRYQHVDDRFSGNCRRKERASK